MPDAVAWETVKRAAKGDSRARNDLVSATVDGVWSLAMRLTRRRDEADDVVQETYVRMFGALGGLEPTGRFEGYLARIATNVVLERWRRQRPSTPASDECLPPNETEPWHTVSRQEDDRRRLAAVWAAIEQLSPDHRAAVLLFYARGQSCDGVARTLDVPVGTVKTWLHRARHQVQHAAEGLLREQAAVNRSPREDEP